MYTKETHTTEDGLLNLFDMESKIWRKFTLLFQRHWL